MASVEEGSSVAEGASSEPEFTVPPRNFGSDVETLKTEGASDDPCDVGEVSFIETKFVYGPLKIDTSDGGIGLETDRAATTAAESSSSTSYKFCAVCGPDSTIHVPDDLVSPTGCHFWARGGKAADDEQSSFWIQCDVCNTWFHGRCVNVEEYESVLLESYHCFICEKENGPSIMKPHHLDHRYNFDALVESEAPTQIGTKRYIEELKKREEAGTIPPPPEKLVKVFADGHEFEANFDCTKEWKRVYLVKNRVGLNLRLPDDNFSIETVADIVGSDRLVDTIDVYKQQTLHMSLGRFLEKWREPAEKRDRLYNFLSLEFANTKLSGIIQPPQLVRDISWVHRFWPDIQASKAAESDLSPTGLSGEVQAEHLRAKPEVALFCLSGMAGSYTDYHIDFGGSSVWYHIFKGKKVFYVAEPSEANLEVYAAKQIDPLRFEISLESKLENFYRVEICEGETLLIPAGWIHAVYTPEDSLVFGGNFLHSLCVPLQLWTYEIELRSGMDDRFMFPMFELCHWYGARSIAEQLKEANEDLRTAHTYIVRGARNLVPHLKQWIARDKTLLSRRNLALYQSIVSQLQRELTIQEKMLVDKKRKIGAKKGHLDAALTHLPYVASIERIRQPIRIKCSSDATVSPLAASPAPVSPGDAAKLTEHASVMLASPPLEPLRLKIPRVRTSESPLTASSPASSLLLSPEAARHSDEDEDRGLELRRVTENADVMADPNATKLRIRFSRTSTVDTPAPRSPTKNFDFGALGVMKKSKEEEEKADLGDILGSMFASSRSSSGRVRKPTAWVQEEAAQAIEKKRKKAAEEAKSPPRYPMPKKAKVEEEQKRRAAQDRAMEKAARHDEREKQREDAAIKKKPAKPKTASLQEALSSSTKKPKMGSSAKQRIMASMKNLKR